MIGCKSSACCSLVGRARIAGQACAANLRPHQYVIIIGEADETDLNDSCKGNLRIDLRSCGKMAHSAYPHLGVNAIDKLLDVLADLRKLPLPVSSALGPSTMNIGVIGGGRAANVVPDQAVAQILIRIVEDFSSSPGPREAQN